MVKKKVEGLLSTTRSNVTPVVAGVCFAIAAMPMPIAFAEGSATDLFTFIIEILCKIGMALGAMYGVFGLMHYAEARQEGDGPAKNKAIGQISAAVLLIIVAAAINAGASTLASFIV